MSASVKHYVCADGNVGYSSFVMVCRRSNQEYDEMENCSNI
jgi:hypothetical protein